jgi:hypothetical protein
VSGVLDRGLGSGSRCDNGWNGCDVKAHTCAWVMYLVIVYGCRCGAIEVIRMHAPLGEKMKWCVWVWENVVDNSEMTGASMRSTQSGTKSR